MASRMWQNHNSFLYLRCPKPGHPQQKLRTEYMQQLSCISECAVRWCEALSVSEKCDVRGFQKFTVTLSTCKLALGYQIASPRAQISRIQSSYILEPQETSFWVPSSPEDCWESISGNLAPIIWTVGSVIDLRYNSYMDHTVHSFWTYRIDTEEGGAGWTGDGTDGRRRSNNSPNQLRPLDHHK